MDFLIFLPVGLVEHPILSLVSFLGGVIPACIWLCFWLFEDRCQPEPKRFIFYAFVAGMIAIGPTLVLQAIAQQYLPPYSLGLIGMWALTEEIMIFLAAYVAALRLYVFDEPIDAIIYMVTAALGFSALENALFLWPQIVNGDLLRIVALGESRFLGATLVHTLSSSTVGIALAISFNKPASMRKLYAICGIILSTILHTTYNYFIVNIPEGAGAHSTQGAEETFWIFVCVWCGIIATLLVIERLKTPKDYC